MNAFILKRVLDYLYDGNPQTAAPLLFIRHNYKRWQEIFNWLVARKICGKKLVEFFQNESKDGRGYHMGVTTILNQIDNKGLRVENIKADQLL